MWQVVFKSSGIIAYSALTRGQAMYWYQCNNFTEHGDDLDLYEVKKPEKPQEGV